MPLAVLFLMYREQLIPCCSSGPPRLLDKDELAMESQQGAEGPDVEQKEHDAGGTDKKKCLLVFLLQFFINIEYLYFLSATKKKKKKQYVILCAPECQ